MKVLVPGVRPVTGSTVPARIAVAPNAAGPDNPSKPKNLLRAHIDDWKDLRGSIDRLIDNLEDAQRQNEAAERNGGTPPIDPAQIRQWRRELEAKRNQRAEVVDSIVNIVSNRPKLHDDAVSMGFREDLLPAGPSSGSINAGPDNPNTNPDAPKDNDTGNPSGSTSGGSSGGGSGGSGGGGGGGGGGLRCGPRADYAISPSEARELPHKKSPAQDRLVRCTAERRYRRRRTNSRAVVHSNGPASWQYSINELVNSGS